MCFSTLCTVRLLYFIWTGALSCLNPFLPLHMRTIGVPIWKSVILSSILPIMQIFTCLVASQIPKYSSSFKKSTLWSLLFTAISALLLVFTPHIPQATDKSIQMYFHCGPEIEPRVIVDKCGNVCENSDLLNESIDAFFTACHVDCPDRSGGFKSTADLCFAHDHGRICHVVEVNNTLSEKFTFGVHLDKGSELNDNQCIHTMQSVTWHDTDFQHVTCPIIIRESSQKCSLKCEMQEVDNGERFYSLSGKRKCLQDTPETVYFAVWTYVGLRLAFHFCLGISTILIETAMKSTINIERCNPKRYIFYSHLSAAFFTPLAGLVLDNDKSADLLFNYKLLFVFFFGFIMLSIVLLGSLEIESAVLFSPSKTILHLPRLLKKIDISAILTVVFALGMVTGFMDTFLFWHLEDEKAPHYVLGLPSSLALIVGLPFLIEEVRTFARKLLTGNMLTLCFLFQTIRCFSYYVSNNYWWFLLIELAEAFSFSLMWCAISGYLQLIKRDDCPDGLRKITGILHYGFGKAIGILAGGISMIYYGFLNVFLGLGIFMAITGTIYFVGYQASFKEIEKELKQTSQPSVVKENMTALMNTSIPVSTDEEAVRES